MEFIGKNDVNHKRIELFLEDKEWKKAIKYCEKSLDQNPESAQTYIYYLLAKLKFINVEEMIGSSSEFFNHPLYKKALDFADENERAVIEGLKYDSLYIQGSKILDKAKKKKHYKSAQKMLSGILEYKNAQELFDVCQDKIFEIKKKNKRTFKISLISFVSVLLVTIIGFICSFFVMENSKTKLLSDIETLKVQRTEIEKEFSPMLKEIELFKTELENKQEEIKTIEKDIDEINNRISYLKERNEYYNQCQLNLLKEIYLEYGNYQSLYRTAYERIRPTILAYDEHIKENKAEIKKKETELKEQKNKLEKANKPKNDAQTKYDNIVNQHREEFDLYNKKINENKAAISNDRKEINKIDELYTKFPYFFIISIFN